MTIAYYFTSLMLDACLLFISPFSYRIGKLNLRLREKKTKRENRGSVAVAGYGEESELNKTTAKKVGGRLQVSLFWTGIAARLSAHPPQSICRIPDLNKTL